MTAPTDSFASLDGAIDAAVRLIKLLQQERDELVAALRGVLGATAQLDSHDSAMYRDEIEAARAALARIEGKKPR